MSNQITKAAATFWASLVAQAWEDDAFEQRLLTEPEQVIREQGYAGILNVSGTPISIKVEKATSGKSCEYDPEANTLTFYLPERPDCLKQLQFNGQFTAGICC